MPAGHYGYDTLADNEDRKRDEWQNRLSQVLSDLSDSRAVADNRADRHPLPPSKLPSWPWTVSSLGLCLALLIVEPTVVENAEVQPVRKPATPQVQGWRRTAALSSTWPDHVPHIGYRGVAVAVAPPAVPIEIHVPPLASLPPVRIALLPPVPLTFAIEGPLPVLATAPPPFPAVAAEPPAGVFVPTQATWIARMPIGGLPHMTTEHPAAPPRRIQATPPAEPEEPKARPRKAATAPVQRERRPVPAKAAPEVPATSGPSLHEKIFGQQRN